MAGFTVEKPEVGPHTFCKGVYNLLSRIRGKQGVQPWDWMHSESSYSVPQPDSPLWLPSSLSQNFNEIRQCQKPWLQNFDHMKCLVKIFSELLFRQQLLNKWLPADTWVEALTKLNLIDHTLMSIVKVGTFNGAMGRNRGDFDGQMISRYDGTNTTGIFRLTFQQAMFYMVTDKNKQVPYPPLDDSWKEAVLTVAKNVFNMTKTRSLFSSHANMTPQDLTKEQAPKKTTQDRKSI